MSEKKLKLWLVFMAGPGSLEDLRELIEPIKSNFDGIVATYHGKPGDEEAKYLESVKGLGEIIHFKFCRRHDVSRNTYLYCGPIQEGDWCLQIDTGERLNVDFAQRIGAYVEHFRRGGVNLIYYYNKSFLFEFHESLQYSGSPHEGLHRRDGNGCAIELSQSLPDEKGVRYNVRNLRRADKFHWVGHYAKYMFEYPWGSNHCLLGLENRGEPRELFGPREAKRLEFRRYCRDVLGIPLKVDALVEYLKKTKDNLDPVVKQALNNEKVWQDVFRYYVLGDETVKDEHKWESMIKI